ncbi:hypothetical protein AVEN_259015-1 [Araneus ventricosus]|uniref:Uncharacterized protein n=1 Tax=Araneus ventricosus TaxID=182803 RepID=A0A4Y2R110_ARAVE|nr:hypothetical protein AVEN_259015-1 [Araneus ventricosus]
MLSALAIARPILRDCRPYLEFSSQGYYDSVLWEIYESFANSGYYFQTLFQELFLLIPRDFRKSFADIECEIDSYFAHILRLQNIKALEKTFRSVDSATRAGLVCSDLASEHFYSSISRGRWNVVEVCLREARISKEDGERLKEAFIGYLTSIELGEMKLKTRKWTRFFQFLEETDAPSKRFSEDETTIEAKMKKI